MKIIVDADGCSVISIVEEVAKHYNIPVILYSDASRIVSSEYSEVKVVDIGRDSADFAILKECNPDDIVVTHDYGLASMVLSMKCKAIHPHGRIYTDDNIGKLLADRHLARRYRMSPRGKQSGKYRPIYSRNCKQGHFKQNLSAMITEA